VPSLREKPVYGVPSSWQSKAAALVAARAAAVAKNAERRFIFFVVARVDYRSKKPTDSYTRG